MLLNLHEVQPDKPLRRELEIPATTLNVVDGEARVSSVQASYRFQVDPLGFAVHYDIRAEARMTCIRCGEPVSQNVSIRDWISLRTRQPAETHVVLNDSEMNVRFTPEERLDLTDFTLELVELALPTYPRHADDHDHCHPQEAEMADTQDSPFSVLSKYLDS